MANALLSSCTGVANSLVQHVLRTPGFAVAVAQPCILTATTKTRLSRTQSGARTETSTDGALKARTGTTMRQVQRQNDRNRLGLANRGTNFYGGIRIHNQTVSNIVKHAKHHQMADRFVR